MVTSGNIGGVNKSLSSWRAWIEMSVESMVRMEPLVALLMESVD